MLGQSVEGIMYKFLMIGLIGIFFHLKLIGAVSTTTVPSVNGVNSTVSTSEPFSTFINNVVPGKAAAAVYNNIREVVLNPSPPLVS